MPVLAAMMAATDLFREDAGGPAGLLAPAALRAKLEGLGEEAGTRVLPLVNRLDGLAAEWDVAAATTRDFYLADVPSRKPSLDDLLPALQPQDEVRDGVLRGLVEVREGLKAALSDQEWELVFG